MTQLLLDLDAAAIEEQQAAPDLTGYEPITCADSAVGRQIVKEILRIIERNACYFDSYTDIFYKSLELIEAAVLCHEDRYMELVGKLRPEALKASVDIMKHLMRMYTDFVVFDVLGCVYMDIASRWKAAGLGQYFTPSDLCEMTAAVTLGSNVLEQVQEARDAGRVIKICDPTIGSGAMILGAKKVILQQAGIKGLRAFRFYGQDLDPVCVRMATIQLHLTDYWYMGNRLIVAAGDAMRKIA